MKLQEWRPELIYIIDEKTEARPEPAENGSHLEAKYKFPKSAKLICPLTSHKLHFFVLEITLTQRNRRLAHSIISTDPQFLHLDLVNQSDINPKAHPIQNLTRNSHSYQLSYLHN